MATTSPYLSPIWEVTFGAASEEIFKVSASVIANSPIADSIPEFSFERTGKHEFVDFDQKIGHTVVHYLYTQKYEPDPSIKGNKKAVKTVLRNGVRERKATRAKLSELTTSADLVNFAITYRLVDLRDRATEHCRAVWDSIPVLDGLDALSKLPTGAKTNKAWLYDDILQKVRAEYAGNAELFTSNRYLECFGRAKDFDSMLYKCTMTILTGKISELSRLHETENIGDEERSVISIETSAPCVEVHVSKDGDRPVDHDGFDASPGSGVVDAAEPELASVETVENSFENSCELQYSLDITSNQVGIEVGPIEEETWVSTKQPGKGTSKKRSLKIHSKILIPDASIEPNTVSEASPEPKGSNPNVATAESPIGTKLWKMNLKALADASTPEEIFSTLAREAASTEATPDIAIAKSKSDVPQEPTTNCEPVKFKPGAKVSMIAKASTGGKAPRATLACNARLENSVPVSDLGREGTSADATSDASIADKSHMPQNPVSDAERMKMESAVGGKPSTGGKAPYQARLYQDGVHISGLSQEGSKTKATSDTSVAKEVSSVQEDPTSVSESIQEGPYSIKQILKKSSGGKAPKDCRHDWWWRGKESNDADEHLGLQSPLSQSPVVGPEPYEGADAWGTIPEKRKKAKKAKVPLWNDFEEVKEVRDKSDAKARESEADAISTGWEVGSLNKKDWTGWTAPRTPEKAMSSTTSSPVIVTPASSTCVHESATACAEQVEHLSSRRWRECVYCTKVVKEAEGILGVKLGMFWVGMDKEPEPKREPCE